MAATPSNRAAPMIAVLALAQGIFGVLRALHWFEIGSDLMERGILLLPSIGMVAYLRGAVVAVIALLYVAFAVGLFTGRDWARPLGLIAALLNLVLVASAVVQGEPFLRALLWAIVPVIVIWHALSPAGRRAINSGAT